MPAPHHLRHPAPHPPHRHTTHIPSPLRTLPLYMHLGPTSCRTFSPRPQHLSATLPHSVPPLFHTHSPHPQHLSATLPHSVSPLFRTHSPHPQHLAATLPHSVSPLFRTHSPHPQHLAAIFLYSFPLLLYAPSAPSSAEKFALPHLKQAVTHLWKSFIPKEEEDLSSTSYPDDTVWITL